MSRRFFTHWLPVVLWMGVIFSASTNLGSPAHTSRFLVPILKWLDPHISPEAIEVIHTCVRKSAHFVEYFILGVLIWRVVHSSPKLSAQPRARHFRLAILIAACYAASDETHQSFVPTRQPAIHDVCLDTFGAACGMSLACWAGTRRKPK